jgi:glucitol operon activator protein
MAIWQWALLALGLVWLMQSIGVWFQMRHYADVFKGITGRFQDGYVGAGHARGRLRKGTIALLVVSPDLVVQRLLLMTGRSVFTKFRRERDVEGMTLAEFRAGRNPDAADSEEKAIALAIEQVDKIRSKAAAPGINQEFAAA